jgi:hypothetical protein|tara:strand:+ start:69 stop:542 length:474 start_codon:yes stop_codon:yes gene_type:complete
MLITKRVIVAALGFVWFAMTTSVAKAESIRIATCGPMKGYSYFYPGPNIAKDYVGFGEDKISSAKTTLAIIDDKPDVISGDWGDPTTARADGADVFMFGEGKLKNDSIVFVVIYPGMTVETYTYNGTDNSLMLLQTKYGALIQKTAMLYSKCSRSLN